MHHMSKVAFVRELLLIETPETLLANTLCAIVAVIDAPVHIGPPHTHIIEE